MEVRIEEAKGSLLPGGSYVSVRIGDVQKQRTRPDANGAYQYSFPAIDRRRNAKIDVYQLVGTCSTVVDPEVPASSEMIIKKTDGGAIGIKLNVGTVFNKLSPAGKPSPDKSSNDIKKAAVDYLSKYQVEEKLSAAVKMLITKMPDNPIEFLCNHLKEMPATVAPTAKIQPLVPCKDVLPFKAYYNSNVAPQASKDFFAKVHAKFPEKPKPKPPPAPAAAPVSRADFAKVPSSGTWIMRKPPKLAFTKTSLPPHVTTAWNLKGLRAASLYDEKCEAERVLTKVLLELSGDFEGEYYPLQSSKSYLAKLGGMSDEDAHILNSSGFLFEAPDRYDASGSGVFATTAEDVAVWVNESNHVQFIVKVKDGNNQAALQRIKYLEAIVGDALKQDGVDFVAPATTSALTIKGIAPPKQMQEDEHREVERILTKALLEMSSELAGEYYPMPSSKSYIPMIGGMSQEDCKSLKGDGVLFFPATGCGIFSTDTNDVRVCVNGEQHVQIIAKQSSAVPKVAAIEVALRDALKQDGYDFV